MVGSVRPVFPRKKRLVRGSVRPFKGGTPRNVFQTLDIGAGLPVLTAERARKYPDRKSLAVDPRYAGQLRDYLGYKFGFRVSDALELMKRSGLGYSSLRANEEIEKLIKNGIKVRHVNFQMPHPRQNYDLEIVFHRLKKVLLPNGKVFMSGEDLPFLEKVANIAKREGYVVRFGKSVLASDSREVLFTMDGRDAKIIKPKRIISNIKIPLTDHQAEYFCGGYVIYNLTLTLSPKTVRKDRKLEEQK
jgi:hypothetical protein